MGSITSSRHGNGRMLRPSSTSGRVSILNQLVRVVVVSVAMGVTAAGEPPASVPPGTRVQVKLLKLITSESSLPGATVQFTVAHDVVIHGLVVISRGTPALGSVTTAKAYPGHHPFWSTDRVSPGQLGFTISETKSVNGDLVRLSGPLLVNQPPHRRPLVTWHHEGEIFDAIVLPGR